MRPRAASCQRSNTSLTQVSQINTRPPQIRDTSALLAEKKKWFYTFIAVILEFLFTGAQINTRTLIATNVKKKGGGHNASQKKEKKEPYFNVLDTVTKQIPSSKGILWSNSGGQL